MNNKLNDQKSFERDHLEEDDLESSKETIEQSNINYESLLKEIKMKSSALAKASNLIEILQMELEVEKESKKEAILNARCQYEKQIEDLRSKIEFLESLPKRGLFLNEQNQHRSESRILSRSGSRSLNRCSSKDKKELNKSCVESPIELNIYKKMLIENSLREGLIIEKLEEMEKYEFVHISEVVSKMEEVEKEIEQNFEKGDTKPKTFSKLKEIIQIIHSQNAIIEDMKSYETQLEDIIKAFIAKVGSIFDDRSFKIPSNDSEFFTEIFNEILAISKEWALEKTSKQKKLESENKELRAIVEEMIGLMNKKKSTSKEYHTLAN